METKELAKFDYGQLDGNTAEFLRRCENEIDETLGQAATRVGGILREAQERLSKHGYGCFREWCEYIGMKKDAVNRLIQRYNLIVANCDERKEIIEALPMTLSYEIAKPSAESTPAKAQAKTEVLAGEIDTLKAYRERIAELENQAETLRDTIESMRGQPPKVEYVRKMSDITTRWRY